MKKRVVITGQGTINALGNNVRETCAAFCDGRPGIGPLEFEDVERLSIRIGAQVRDFRPEAHFSQREIALFDRFTQFAVYAAREAIKQSGLRFDGQLSEQAGVILGNAGGGLLTQDATYRSVYEAGKNRVHPFVVPRLMNNAAASHLSIIHNLKGPSFTVSSACASSNHAMGQAFQLVRSGITPVMISGGSEAMLCFGGVKAWEGLRVMSPDACRPFSANRNGMVLGEGAAIFVFEDYDHARARGAEMLAEIKGFAMNSDASDIVAPSRAGAARAMSNALAEGQLLPGDIGYINAHGTGTRVNDKTECAAISQVFGAKTGELLVSSSKSMHGHLIGGAGAVELLAVIMAIKDGVIAPTIGHQHADPDCALEIVANTARKANVTSALSNAFGFGGLNAVLALGKV